MKTLKKILAAKILLAIILLTGCDIVHNDYDYDYTPPAPPRNIVSITGDNRIDLMWDHNREKDLAGYNVYWSYSYNGAYELIGSTSDNYFIDWDAVNGETYYYAVTAYDYNGNESDLSNDVVYDTPRPEGFNQTIYDYLGFPTKSGYSFSDYRVVAYNSDLTDFFFENFNGTYYLNVWEDTDIQDMGPTNDIWDISWAPDRGWVPINDGENVKYTEAIEGHT
ncbi:MAG: hypothetical protein JW866_05025, partial [Ignavibacteriales bacterium]|nr:hypothetical protein [Ignavibacteriales bacterium]